MSAKHLTLTPEYVRSLLDYDPATGIFRWKVSKGKRSAGSVAGCSDGDGYGILTIDRIICRTARLAFFYVNGRWPKNKIDHKNNTVDDDRIDNLREADDQQNTRNRRLMCTSKSGYKGVHYLSKGTRHWRAVIMVNYKGILLGDFDTPEEGARAYDKAAKKYFGEFAHLNFPE